MLNITEAKDFCVFFDGTYKNIVKDNLDKIKSLFIIRKKTIENLIEEYNSKNINWLENCTSYVIYEDLLYEYMNNLSLEEKNYINNNVDKRLLNTNIFAKKHLVNEVRKDVKSLK